MNWIAFLIVWIFLGVATLGLALYRKFLTMREDDLIHVEGWQASLAAKQEQAARRFHSIDVWGEALTITTIIGGLALAIAYVYIVLSRA